ncbi:MAG: MltA domain-containing protein [Beijerinckiaceae bacterium]|nr:MltA domain-containing protein [Beijerinckiaceae bacterium]
MEVWPAFRKSCERVIRDASVLRTAAQSPTGLAAKAELALRTPNATESEIRTYFSDHFRAFRILPRAGSNPHAHGFVTGYYEPEISATLEQAPDHTEPVLGRPEDLLNTSLVQGSVTYASSRLLEDGRSSPYWRRAEISAGKSGAPAIAWVRDAIELFMIQVQGSARVVLPDGTSKRLVYAGRNGHPYESIGRILVSEGHVPLADMSLDVLKDWVRRAGQAPGQAGRMLLYRNPSYVFFKLVEDVDPAAGPIGGEGVPLTKLRSLAIDRAIWAYGLPFWMSGDLPMENGATEKVQRLMVAQDTGSAIVGAARGDIFYGSGNSAGQTAARVRHVVDLFVMIPKG